MRASQIAFLTETVGSLRPQAVDALDAVPLHADFPEFNLDDELQILAETR